MKYYTVHMPPVPSQDRLEQAEELVFVREGFAWMAFLATPIWMLINRLWFECLFYVIAMVAWSQFSNQIGLPEFEASVCLLVASLILGFEGNNLIRWKLDRQEYRLVGTVSGLNKDECELKFFTYWKPEKSEALSSGAHIPGTPAGTAKMAEYELASSTSKHI